MLEITIISGKGGTGKTSLTGAFAHLAENHVICDLDVDAPDLHLLLNPEHRQVVEFYSGHYPVIDPERCTDCGDCLERCRFDAIHRSDDGPVIDLIACEGCKVCVHFCPEKAIDWFDRHCGQWYVSDTRFGPMVHALLFPGQENSGLLVSQLRKKSRELAEEQGLELILSDGSPGIGCPVISSLTGTDLAVIVTEPTPSGLHDLDRVAGLCDHFKIPVGVIINKCDLNPDVAESIGQWCAGREIGVLGRIEYDPAFTEAMVNRRVITEYASGGMSDRVRAMWQRILDVARMKKAA